MVSFTIATCWIRLSKFVSPKIKLNIMYFMISQHTDINVIAYSSYTSKFLSPLYLLLFSWHKIVNP